MHVQMALTMLFRRIAFPSDREYGLWISYSAILSYNKIVFVLFFLWKLYMYRITNNTFWVDAIQ